MTDWEKFLARRKENIGFVTRLGAFKEPTEAEKAVALAIEIDSWQITKGKTTFTKTAEYSKPLHHLIENWDHLEAAKKAAGKAYVSTPMDPNGTLKELGIEVAPYENPQSLIGKIINWFKKDKTKSSRFRYWHGGGEIIKEFKIKDKK